MALKTSNSDPLIKRIDGATNKDIRQVDADGRVATHHVQTLSYPANLDAEEFGGNKVLFFINVPGTSRIAREDEYNYTTQEVPKFRYNKVTGQAVGAAANAIMPSTGSLKNAGTKRRLTRAIALYVPAGIAVNYGVSWDQTDMTKASLADEIIGGVSGNNGKASGEGGFLDGLKGIATAGASYAAGKKLNKSAVGDAVKQAAGVATNSKQEQLFKGVLFREFGFDYKFVPRTEKEAEQILRIIRTFRHHMLPEFLDSSEFLYVYPSEFDIRYYHGEEENPHMEKYITSVLTNMSINYTPLGMVSTFPNGMPTHINMTLGFREIGTTSKESSPEWKAGV